MSILPMVSHVVNVLVAGVMGTLLAARSPLLDPVYGADSPARRILACLYLAIALASAFALVFRGPNDERLVAIALVLFPLQILYKTLTPFVVGSLTNPVVLWNLGISALHAASLWSLRARF